MRTTAKTSDSMFLNVHFRADGVMNFCMNMMSGSCQEYCKMFIENFQKWQLRSRGTRLLEFYRIWQCPVALQFSFFIVFFCCIRLIMMLINRRNQSYIVMLAFKLIDKQMVSFKIPLSKLEVGQASLETIFPQGNEIYPFKWRWI